MDLEEKYRELQKQKKIVIQCNGTFLEVDDALNVAIKYTCGNKEKTAFLKLLKYPDDYYALLFGDVIFQKRLRCNGHCNRRLRFLRLKPFKSEDDHRKIWNLEHGRKGFAELTIRLATPAA